MAVAMQHNPAGSCNKRMHSECSKMFRTLNRKKYFQLFIWPRILVIFSHFEPNISNVGKLVHYKTMHCSIWINLQINYVSPKVSKSHNTSCWCRVELFVFLERGIPVLNTFFDRNKEAKTTMWNSRVVIIIIIIIMEMHVWRFDAWLRSITFWPLL